MDYYNSNYRGDKMQCAIYTRVSTDNQVEVEYNSCESQTEKIKSFIKSQEKMEVFKIYSDPGFTGANMDRPGLQEMLRDIQRNRSLDSAFGLARDDNRIDMVIVYKMDRLTRSPKDFYHLIELFEQYNVGFISVTERFDTSTPSGRLLRNIMLTFAQFERELASERVKDKMLQRATKGMWNGGTVAYGYKTVKKRLVINDEEAKLLRKIYDLYISTGSLCNVMNTLRTRKIKNRLGQHFSKNALYYMLRNINYTGKTRYANRISEGMHPPIIPEEVFNKAQVLHGKKEKPIPFYKHYPLVSLIKCSECGSRMTPCFTYKKNKKRKHYYYYRCTKTLRGKWNDCSTQQVSAERLENFIFQNLERISLDKRYIDSFIFMLNNSKAGDHSGLELRPNHPKIDPETFRETLQSFVRGLAESKGVQKTIFVKKHIKKIAYSREEIVISLYYKTSFEGEKSATAIRPASGRAGAAAGRIPEFGSKKPSRGTPGGLRVVKRLDSDPAVDIILPNAIHRCKKKDL